MAYPALIQKILALRQDMQDVHDVGRTFATVLIELAEQSIRMSGRIAALELDGAESLASRVEIAKRVSSLERDSNTQSEAHIDLARECIRMSDRLVDQELGAEHPNLAPVLSTYCDPEGYDLFCGAKVAPLTIVNDGHPTHRGAALTVVLDEISKS